MKSDPRLEEVALGLDLPVSNAEAEEDKAADRIGKGKGNVNAMSEIIFSLLMVKC